MPREVLLSRSLVATVDEGDYELVSSFSWHGIPAAQRIENWYARTGEGIYMHRLIMSAASGEEVDHRDHNGLNNTRGNLRLCTRQQNCANSNFPLAASGYIGVYWERDRRKWVAQVTVDYKTIRVGRYSDPIEAARARDSRVREMYGEFAKLNFPLSSDDVSGRGSA